MTNDQLKIIPNNFKTYLMMINNSVGINMFKNLYVLQGNKEFDATKNGTISCAFFVSSVLTIFGVLDAVHATVQTTVSKMQESGWQEVDISDIKEGDIIVWKN